MSSELVRTPAEDAERLSVELRTLARRLEAAEDGDLMYSKEDVERIVEGRIARERKKRRVAEREVEELEDRLARLERS